jgi:hypothetical protein
MDHDTGLFEVIYEENNEVCQFNLLEDLENDDLKVL